MESRNITGSTAVVPLLCSFSVADPRAIEQGRYHLLLFATGPLHVHKPSAARLQTATHLRCIFIATHVHLQSMEEDGERHVPVTLSGDSEEQRGRQHVGTRQLTLPLEQQTVHTEGAPSPAGC